MNPPQLVQEIHWFLLAVLILVSVLCQYALVATSKEIWQPDHSYPEAEKRQKVCRIIFGVTGAILLFPLARIFRTIPPASQEILTWWAVTLGYFLVGGFIFYLLRRTWDAWERSYTEEFFTYLVALGAPWLFAIMLDKLNETFARIPLPWVGALALVAFGVLVIRDLGRR